MRYLLYLCLFLTAFRGLGQEQKLNLMPWPLEVSSGAQQFIISSDFTIAVPQNASRRVHTATTRFLRRLSGRSGVFINAGFPFEHDKIENPSLIISYDTVGKLDINQDESYKLTVSATEINVNAKTDIGVIYALETLLQLLSNNNSSFYFPEIDIVDSPRFTWRGLMIDAARHFQPVGVIKRNLDAMAAVKLNVLHWHLTDDQGFRVESKTHPKLHELGSDGQYYTQNQIKDIVQYASDRGIRVVPEFDVPGHATAILTAYPEIGSKDTTYTIERYAGIFDPTIDPTNEKSYEILGDLFGEMAALFPDKYFHIGGDENAGKHWNENADIQQFKKKHNLKTNHDLQTYFNIRLEKKLNKFGKAIMGWEEIMTDNMPTSALIHSWKGVNEGQAPGKSLAIAAKRGYKTILSNGFYIDLMQPAAEHYRVDPMPKGYDLTDDEKKRILGGEATMWAELVTPLTIDSRIWPRTAAIAERLWSPAHIKDEADMYSRLEVISFRLEELGITHLRNRDVILRNISGNQKTEPLINLTNVYEPLKIYTRNKGGTEYKSYSPFTLFADACSADAVDGRIFNTLTTDYLSLKETNAKAKILSYLNKWVKTRDAFDSMKKNSPLMNNIAPLSTRLGNLSETLINIIEVDNIKPELIQKLKELRDAAAQPVEDVELVILPAIDQFIAHYSKIDKF